MSFSVWIIEDDDFFRSSLEELISSERKIRLELSAGSVEEALKKGSKKKSPDVVLMDIGLPGMSGIDGVSEIKTRWLDTEIIMLTIYEDDDRIFKAIKAGASGYLLKRTPAPQILEAIQEVTDGGAPITPSIARKVLNILSGKSSSSNPNPLTDREQEVLKLLVEGYTLDMISAELYISPLTVGTHVKNIYKKLHVHNRSSAVAKALRNRLVE